jgi:hypothetical protein
VRLNSQGNLIAGAIARTWVGFLLNPVTVIKARYEVSLVVITPWTGPCTLTGGGD